MPWVIGSPLASTQSLRPVYPRSRPGSAGSSGDGQATRSAGTSGGTRSSCRRLPSTTSAAPTTARAGSARPVHPSAPIPTTEISSVTPRRYPTPWSGPVDGTRGEGRLRVDQAAHDHVVDPPVLPGRDVGHPQSDGAAGQLPAGGGEPGRRRDLGVVAVAAPLGAADLDADLRPGVRGGAGRVGRRGVGRGHRPVDVLAGGPARRRVERPLVLVDRTPAAG